MLVCLSSGARPRYRRDIIRYSDNNGATISDSIAKTPFVHLVSSGLTGEVGKDHGAGTPNRQ
jgi:hypothetical protein